MIPILLGVPSLFIGFYLAMQHFIPSWSEIGRGFQVFEKHWGKIYGIAGVFATATGLILHNVAGVSLPVSFSVSAIIGLLLVSAYTDFITGKVPLEHSNLTIWVAFILGVGSLAMTAFGGNPSLVNAYYDNSNVIYMGSDQWLWLGGSFGVALILFLIWFRTANNWIVSLFAIILGSSALWVACYAGLSLLNLWLVSLMPQLNSQWPALLIFGLPSMLIIVLLTVAFDLGAGNKMGGADTKAMYAAGWAFGAVIGGVNVGIALIVACLVQIIIHTFAKPLGVKGIEVKALNGPKRQAKLDAKWEEEGKEGSAPTFTIRRKLPFLPVMNLSIIVTVVLILTV